MTREKNDKGSRHSSKDDNIDTFLTPEPNLDHLLRDLQEFDSEKLFTEEFNPEKIFADFKVEPFDFDSLKTHFDFGSLASEDLDFAVSSDPGMFSDFESAVHAEPLPPPDPNLSEADAAAWMKEEVERTDRLYHHHAVSHIHAHFGDRFTTTNKLGNRVIDSEVLREFLKLTRNTVVWVRNQYYWRKRRTDDPPRREVRG